MSPIYGLYSCVMPSVIYGLFGTSGQISVGPTNVVSLLSAQAVANYGTNASEDTAQAAITVAFIAGITQLILGLLRFGFVTNFLSKSLMSGFVTSAAFIIVSISLFLVHSFTEFFFAREFHS